MQWFHHNFYDITREMIDAKFQLLPAAYVNPEFQRNRETTYYTNEDLTDVLDYLTHDVAHTTEADDETFENFDFWDETQAQQYDADASRALMTSIVNRLQSLGDNHYFIVNTEAGNAMAEFAKQQHVELGDIFQPFINDESLNPDDPSNQMYIAAVPNKLLEMLYEVPTQNDIDFEQVLIQFDAVFFDADYPDVVLGKELNFYKYVESELKDVAKS